MAEYWRVPAAQHIDPNTLARDLDEPAFHYHLWHFLEYQLEVDATSSPFIYIPNKIYVYSSAIATFHAPSDLCGTGAMHHECIHAVSSWRHGRPQYDCILVNADELQQGMHGMNVTHAKLFFSVTMNHIKYPCVLIHWYSLVGDSPDENMGMWVVKPDILDNGRPWTAVIHLDTIVCLAHLLPIYRERQVPRGMKYTDSLDTFSEFYVTKFADHHTFEIAF